MAIITKNGKYLDSSEVYGSMLLRPDVLLNIFGRELT